MPDGALTMATGVGLFGKTQFRRDFLSVGLPRPLLGPWEAWLARGLARSRDRLGADWVQRFLTMPVWHGALGREVCGTAAALAVMPSMDGAGRCFPLTVLAWSDDPGAAVAAEPWQRWAEAAEAFLLDTLDEAGSHEATLAALGRLPPFPGGPDAASAVVGPAESQWWTRGGERSPPERFEARGWPDEDGLAIMIGEAPVLVALQGDEQHAG